MNKKFGFTVVEILVFLTIAGIISAVFWRSFSGFDKGIRYIYSNTYEALDRSLFNAVNYTNLENPFERTTIAANGSETEVSSDEGAKRLCLMLTRYINPVEDSCNSLELVDDKGKDGSFKKPAFIAGNGVYFYLSGRYPENNKDTSGNEIPTFYIIYADINGKKLPNSMTYVAPSDANHHHTTDPDIFAFAALDIGRICPIGVPEVEPRYLKTRFSYNDSENNEMVRRFTSKSKPYYYTKAETMGYYAYGTTVKDTDYVVDDPYTYNGYIKDHISSDSKIYEFLSGKSLTEQAASNGKYPLPSSLKLKSGSKDNGGYNCKNATEMEDEVECELHIDRYIH